MKKKNPCNIFNNIGFDYRIFFSQIIFGFQEISVKF